MSTDLTQREVDEIKAEAEKVMFKYIPNGVVNLKAKGAGNGKPQYDYEKRVLTEMIAEPLTAERKRAKVLQTAFEEIMKLPQTIGHAYQMQDIAKAALNTYNKTQP